MIASEQNNKYAGFNIYIGTFLIAFSTLSLEVTLTRLLSVITFYHMAFFAVSTAMLGMTAGAVTVYLKPHWFSGDKLNKNTALACFGYSLSVPAALILLCLTPMIFNLSLINILGIFTATIACSLPFYFSGMVVSLVLTKYSLPIGKLYSSDLIGASLGCLFVLGGLEIIDAPSLIILGGAVGSLSVFCFTYKTDALRLKKINVAALFILIALVVFNSLSSDAIRPVIVKEHIDNPLNYIVEKWNSYSKVVVYKGVQGVPRNWGPSPVMPENFSVYYYEMTIDGEAGTILYRNSKPEDTEFLRYDITNAAYYLREGFESACVLGVGGGKDIQSAIKFGFKKVVGVDVNPVFIDLLKNKFRDEAGIANNPGVKLVVDEARSYLSRSDEKFSLIQMSLIDTWASTGAGAFTLTENSLYTTEAWKVFFDHLDENGIYTVSRWYNPQNLGETGRVVSLAVAALIESGINEPSRNIAMMTIGRVSTLIISKRPFTRDEIKKLKTTADSLKYNLVIVPGETPENNVLNKIISSGSLDDLHNKVKDEILNYEPPTDNNPYFFNMLKISRLSAALTKNSGVVYGNLIASLTLVILIFSLFILTVITIIIPLMFGSHSSDGKKVKLKIYWKGAFYFSLIGAGFMMTEIGLMQRLSVFLGHPVYALGILLFTIILSAGIGSFFSERVDVNKKLILYILPAVAAAAIISFNLILNAVISSMITSLMISKILVSIVIMFPIGFILGFFFPIGMRLVKSRSPEETPWLWALNGV
ncbi:MAG TPA: hypothetical protein VJ455_01065, partial [Ignavibacteria bacterium]|nr:hypothetical protein [Ignavibacteria bacterium]